MRVPPRSNIVGPEQVVLREGEITSYNGNQDEQLPP
jgi:hypothetical protein